MGFLGIVGMRTPIFVTNVVCILLILFSSCYAFPITMSIQRSNHPMSTTSRHFTSKQFKEEDDEDIHDVESSSECTIQPYGNRSLAWTRRYREHFPYEYAHRQAMDLGLRNKEEWEEYIQDGKVYHGPYLISRPEEMYADEWVSWEEFLGVMRPYQEVRDLVRNVLKLRDLEEYTQFVRQDPKRAELLRIPLKPHLVYRDQWTTSEDFFGVYFQ